MAAVVVLQNQTTPSGSCVVPASELLVAPATTCKSLFNTKTISMDLLITNFFKVKSVLYSGRIPTIPQ
jgi:hypothetical protein